MQLAQPGDPLVTNNGAIVEAEGRREPSYTIDTPIARNIKPKVARSVRELGTDGETQSVINVVLMYHLLGISVNETAHILNTTPAEVENIKKLSAFQDTFELLHREMISAQSTSMVARIQSYAGRALTNLMDLADEKPVEITETDSTGKEFKTKHFAVPPIVILKANDSVLDRAGLSADTLFGKDDDAGGSMLEIEITSAESNKTNVKVNLGKK